MGEERAAKMVREIGTVNKRKCEIIIQLWYEEESVQPDTSSKEGKLQNGWRTNTVPQVKEAQKCK